MSHEVRIAGSDIRFPCRSGETLLDAALHAGIEMPYSCRKGVCGNCAGRVTAGSVQCPLGSAEVAEGQHLFCQCTPVGDVEIAPHSYHRIDPSARKRFTVKVFRNHRVAGDVNLLHLRLPAGRRAKFKAGQYLQLTLADGSRRSYSMANPPHESDGLSLHVRHVAGGQFTQIVPTLAPGDTLQVELPYGNFELREEASAPLVFIAGGTGFAPVKSLIDDIAKRRVERPITLFWGARTASGIYLSSAVDRWKKVLPNFTFHAVVEDAVDASAMTPPAFVGRVDGALRAHCPTLVGHEVYCCGAPAMVVAVRRVCVGELGLDTAKFFSDVFVPGPAAAPL